jgi:hypothetical protein
MDVAGALGNAIVESALGVGVAGEVGVATGAGVLVALGAAVGAALAGVGVWAGLVAAPVGVGCTVPLMGLRSTRKAATQGPVSSWNQSVNALVKVSGWPALTLPATAKVVPGPLRRLALRLAVPWRRLLWARTLPRSSASKQRLMAVGRARVRKRVFITGSFLGVRAAMKRAMIRCVRK